MPLYTAPMRGMSVFSPVRNEALANEGMELGKIVSIHPDGVHVDVVFRDGKRVEKINIDRLEPSGASIG